MTQCEKVLQHIEDYGSITQAEAVSFYGCYRLGARIADLKKLGVKIRSERVTVRNRYGEPVSFSRYYLEDGPCETQ